MCSSEWLRKSKSPWWVSGAPSCRRGNHLLPRIYLLLLTASDLLPAARRRHAVINRVGGAGRAAAGLSDSCCFGGQGGGAGSQEAAPPAGPLDVTSRRCVLMELRGHLTSEVTSPELPAWLFTAAASFPWVRVQCRIPLQA